MLPTYVHLVTLINRRTEDEICLKISTATDSFAEVMREICQQRAIKGLKGYEVYEVLECQEAPF
jgi:hypothetical protein